ncbi:hypothetical protein [Streptacidiphilus fuscans]|uniref:Uncharacterized protein n=1 Tax=Streptacidiphilus fuscans TaxID=2789292 RepID=A0A931B827_9ACTN|nr:hypothetical protein [Streptacidiphilus fuscans]MBF9071197.1 hypothetical protein [Streptacidiphilus fuscans]
MTWAWDYNPDKTHVAGGAPLAFLAAVEEKVAEVVRMAEAVYLDGTAYTGGPLSLETVAVKGGMFTYGIIPRLELVLVHSVSPNP